MTKKQKYLTWEKVKNTLLKNYGKEVFYSWFNKITFIEQKNHQIKLSVENKFTKDWLSNHYLEEICKIWKKHDSLVKEITIEIPNQTEKNVNNDLKFNIHVSKQQNLFSTNLDKRCTFKNFVVGSSNELAYSASRAIAESQNAIPESNPLFLYGGVGLGKTHLMHSIAWHILFHNKNRKVIYISAEKFMYQFVQAIRNKKLIAFKEHFRSVDVLMIDDIQFICGKDSTQEEFFHTFNTLIDNHSQMVISCDRSPSDLDNIEDRIKSRLGWGLVADVHSTNFELRVGIIQSKIEQMETHVFVSKEIIEFLAKTITSNTRELEGALKKIIAHSNLVKKTCDIETAKELLKDLIRSREISIEEVKSKVARHYGIKISDMSSDIKTRKISRPRQVAMYFCKLIAEKKVTEIGENFGNKNHSTVIKAIQKVEFLCKFDTEFTHELNIIKKAIQN